MIKLKHLFTLLLLIVLTFTLRQSFAQEEVKSYESVIKSADSKFAEKDYISAKTYYEMALRFKEEDAYAKSRLAETMVLLKKQMEVQEVFYKHLDLADQLYSENKMDEALTEYNEALKVFPNDKYALSKAAKITETLDAEKQKSEGFNKAISLGEKLVLEQKYEEALFQYNEANTLIPNQKEVTEKIANINKKIDEQRITRENFNKLKTEAEQAIARRDYVNAIEKFKQALVLMPTDAKTLTQLAETNLLYEKSTKYNAILADADNLYAEKMLPEAKVQYELAMQVWPEQAYPVDMIKRIDQTLRSDDFKKMEAFNSTLADANKLFENKDYEPSLQLYIKANSLKPEDEFVQQRIAEIDRIQLANNQMIETDAKYAKSIADAKTNFEAKQYEQALVSYKEANILKPKETEPAEKIKEIELIIVERNASNALQMKYDALIQTADEQFASNELVKSKGNYAEAAALLKDQAYPLAQINKIEKILVEQELTAKTENQYTSLIQSADAAFNEKKWSEAKNDYSDAQKIKPAEVYPANQIVLINQTLAQIEKENVISKQYNEAIRLADNKLSEEKFEDAIKAYQAALVIKPDENYPQNQIVTINEKMRLLSESKALEQKLTELKNQAEAAIGKKEYQTALNALNQMVTLDISNLYAPAKIAEIKLIQESMALENQRLYDEAIADATNKLEAKDFDQAIIGYKTALNYKPADAYATEKIKLIDTILREKLLIQTTTYTKLITEADRQLNAKLFDKAVELYLQAEQAKNDETYPREMIRKISKMLEDQKLFDLNAANLIVPANTSKRFEFKPVDVIERRGNYILVKARNTGSKSFPLIVSFGSKNGKNGGFVLPIPEKEGFNDFIVRIGSQYKWFSEDNTWIEIYPENGEVEVGLMQISKSE